jgi:hypothetical protein
MSKHRIKTTSNKGLCRQKYINRLLLVFIQFYIIKITQLTG